MTTEICLKCILLFLVLTCTVKVQASVDIGDLKILTELLSKFQEHIFNKSTKGEVAKAVGAGGNGPDFRNSALAPHAEPSGASEETAAAATPSCKCVHYLLCDTDTGDVDQHGERVINMRDSLAVNGSHRNPCHYLEMCCDKLKPETKLKSELRKETSYVHQSCGVRHEKPKGLTFRIIGAPRGEAQFGEFPWIAAILGKLPRESDKDEELNYLIGQGSLIHPRAVLTAAHRIKNKAPSDFWVRLGEWDTQTTNEPYPYQEFNVSQVFMHEKFDAETGFNDIALLILEKDATFAPNVDTICLPPATANFSGVRCYAAGWGKQSFEREGDYPAILKKVDLPYVERDECENALRTTRLGDDFELDQSFVCAGGEHGKDTCLGDGGAPLVCQLPNSDHYAQLGIVSWGVECGRAGIPGVYTDVRRFQDWIQQKMRAAGLETKYYQDGLVN